MIKNRMTWDKWAAILAPLIAVIFFAGIAQSEVKSNTRINDSQQSRIAQVEREIAETKADYKYILRALENIEKKIDGK